MTVRGGLFGVFAVYLVLLAIGGAAAYFTAISRDDARARERTYITAFADAAQLRVAFLNQETGQRGFLLTGEEPFLEPYRRGGRDARRLLALPELRTPELLVLTMRVEEAQQTWLREFAVPQIDARRAADGPIAQDPAADTAGRRRFDRLRAATARLEARVERLRVDAANELDDLRDRLNLVVAFVVGFGLLWTLAAMTLIRRWITGPLLQLRSTADRARSGELDAVVPAVGPQEIADVGAAVEAMRYQLVSARLDAVHAREAIEQSAEVVLTLRSQLESEIGDLPNGWSVAAELRPAEGLVAGDCYDVIRASATSLHVVLVDISGHGAVSGVLALRCKELLRAALRNGLDPGPAIDFAADQLDDLGDETFLTAFVASIDLDSGAIAYANAGHPPGLHCARSGAITELGPTGPLVGPVPAARWRTATTVLGASETLALYTDGIIESHASDRQEFGTDRLIELVRAGSCDQADAIARQCIDDVEAFQDGRVADDLTVVLICREPREPLAG